MAEIITIILGIGVGYVMGHIEEIYFWLHEPEQPEDTEFDINQQFLDINRYGNDYAKRKYIRGEYFVKKDDDKDKK